MRRRVVAFAVTSAVLGFSWLGAKPACAADLPAEDAPSNVVQVFVAGSDEMVARTRITVQELLARLELPAIVRDAAGAGEQLLHGGRSRGMISAYVDLRTLSAPRVIVVDGASGAELERRTLPSATSIETAVEAASHVLYMTIESVVKTRADERERKRFEAVSVPERAAAATPTPSPVSATTKPGPEPEAREVRVAEAPPEEDEKTADTRSGTGQGATWGGNVGVFGAVRSFGSSRVLGGAGLSVEVAAQKLAVHPGVFASAAFFAPGEVSDSGASGSLSAVSARVGPLVGFQAASFVTLFVGAGLGVDVVRFGPDRAPPGATTPGSISSTDVVVAPTVGAKFSAGRSLAVCVGLAADVDTAPRRYVVDRGAVRDSLFDLSRVRPSAFVGLSLAFAGAPQFGERTR